MSILGIYNLLPAFAKVNKEVVTIIPADKAVVSANIDNIYFSGECRLGSFTFPIDPIVNLKRRRKIVKTELSGFDGSVKEDMGFEDYAVSILAVIQSPNEAYPDIIVGNLRKEIESTIGSISIMNSLLAVFDINRIAIDDIDYTTPEGMGNACMVSISAWSDSMPESIIRRLLK
jgi:hypothetical protein